MKSQIIIPITTQFVEVKKASETKLYKVNSISQSNLTNQVVRFQYKITEGQVRNHL